MIVLKFGGSSVADASCMRQVAGLVTAALPKAPLVVLSAMGKTTNGLFDAAKAAELGDLTLAMDRQRTLMASHRNAAAELFNGNVPETLDVALPAGTGTAAVVERVRRLGEDPAVHGILVQLPLALDPAAPGAPTPQAIFEAIPPAKDVDGFHPVNVGRLAAGLPGFVPCTPRGIHELLRHYEVPLAGRHVVVLGRSNIVGRPLATLLSRKGVDATVTLGHSASGPGLLDLARQADVLVCAIGSPEMVTAEWVRPGATVVDVGVHRIPDPTRRTGSRLVGDVEAGSVSKVAGALTPVPGGVGPMTVAMVLANTVLAASGTLTR